MATLTKAIPDFSQYSSWQNYQDYDEPGFVIISTTPSTDTDTKSVDISAIPNGSVINSATITASLGSPLKGAAVRTLDGSTFGGSKDIKSKLTALGGVFGAPLEFVFKFKSKGGLTGSEYDGMSSQPHTSTQSYSDISIVIDYTPPYSACGAPTAATLSASVAETDPTLSFSGAKSGGTNTITGYEIQYAESPNGTTWGAWTALKTIALTATSGSTTVALPSTRGYYRKYHIRAQGSMGSTYYSPWKETSAVRKNSIPSAPANVYVSPGIYEAGGTFVLWTSSADADNNVSAYEVQRALSVDGTTWGSWENVNANAIDFVLTDNPTIPRGQYVKYRVRARDVFGQVSLYTESTTIRRNQAPNAPAINYPPTEKTTYNIRPRILVTIGSEPDGQAQSLASAGYTPSTAGPYAPGKKLVLRKADAASPGAVSFSVTPSDDMGAAGDVAGVSAAYVAPNWTDAPVQKGGTRPKAAHMNELRTAINTMRSYYGLPDVVWAESIEAGTTSPRNWPAHITEMRAAINEIVALVNGWDASSTTNNIVLPAWTSIRGAQPQADVMEQLRAVIALL